MTSPLQPLTAISPSHNLIAITNTSHKPSLIRCYDPTSSSLKFTLRIPKPATGDDDEPYSLQKLIFSSDQFFVASSGNTLIIWDVNRGIASQIIDVDKKETLSDIAAASEGRLYALTHHAHGDRLKVRVMQYACNEGKLQKKIKMGSCRSTVLGLDVVDDVLALRMGDVLKLSDLEGVKLAKIDLPASEQKQAKGCVVKFSRDGSHLLAPRNGNVMLFRVGSEGNKWSLLPLAVLKPKDNGAVTNLDTLVTSEFISVIVFQYGVGASYFAVSAKKELSSLDGMVPLLPTATVETKLNDAIISSNFHVSKNEMQFVFRHASNAPGSGTVLPMESISCKNNDGTGITGTITLTSPSEEKEDKNKKRKMGSKALAPGETGTEASMTTDLTATKKKKREIVEAVDEDGKDVEMRNDEEEDDFKLEEDEEGEHGQSIAERLAMLSSAMEETDEEDDFDNEDEEAEENDKAQAAKTKFNPKSATSETLTTLLTQALSSNDSIQLNIALQITDARMVENTVKALQLLDARRDNTNSEGYLPMLMGHIVRRMARRHTLVTSLMSWIKAILLVSSQVSSRQMLQDIDDEEEERMAREGRELALKLGPLRNFLNERVECFPQLLRLEGRLALLGQQL